MLKKALLCMAAGVVLVSCKETPVSINFEGVEWDTTYVAAAEPPQTKNFLVEEFTGVRCPNCPDGAEILHDLNGSGSFADRLTIVAIHCANGGQSAPITNKEVNSIQDFRFAEAENIAINIYGGISQKPSAGFDRMPVDGTNILNGNRFTWQTSLENIAAQHSSTPVNIDITTEKLEENYYRVDVKVAYTQSLEGKQALSVFLVENDIVDAQEYGPPISAFDTFTFAHVLRKTISPYNGQELLPMLTTKEAGRVYIQRFFVKIDPANEREQYWKPENMEVVAFVHKTGSDDKQVYQSVHTKLNP